MATIAACIVCRNEAAKLEPCLASVAWADEVLVLDLDSSDGSADVARRAGARVFSRPPHPIVEPLRNEIAAHTSSTWILAIDPDERVSPGLAAELRRRADRSDLDAVVVPRMNIDFGWPPSTPQQRYEPQLRMYRAAAITWPEYPNALPKVPEDRLDRIPARDDLVMEHHRNVDVAETAERLVRYAPAQAQAMLARGDQFTAAAMFRELRRVTYRHVITARAWEEGVPGLVRAVILVNHHVYVWIAFWQQSGAPRTPDDDARVARLGWMLRALGLPRTIRRIVRTLRTRPRRDRRRTGRSTG